MDKATEKLEKYAKQLAEYASESEYLSGAFYNIIGKKLLKEGYNDCNFILSAVGKGDYYSRLRWSKIRLLYTKNYPVSEDITTMLGHFEKITRDLKRSLTCLEEEAIVFWAFLPYIAESKWEERTICFYTVVRSLLNLWNEKNKEISYKLELKIHQGIIYDAAACELELIENVGSYVKDISHMKQKNADHILYFRGHSRLSYELLPGIKRSRSWMENENRMYQELIVRCAQDFAQCEAHLDYLVEMQHYGLPTRLLDITENPLVALYFACCGSRGSVGEVIVLQTDTESTKYARSDTAAILAALPVFDFAFQTRLFELCINGIPEEQDRDYLQCAAKLAGEVKSKNPGFEPRIRKKDLFGQVFIMPLRSNPRIMKQDGSFILCGLGDGRGEGNSLRNLRYRNESGKKLIFIVKNKENILRELDLFSINKAALFPEIDDVAEYIKEKYTGDE
ncbi:FRG domain-containing protein [Eisenbergiella porci]|uniref:FRG domain-containing protein n=1 Tax=Eisenbergiella porci TaxID=2652274 RepID=UPI002A7EE929|nr:FRG domain-containing protein [Eisenbergiella porci]